MSLISLRKHLNNHGITESDVCYSDENLNSVQRLSDLIRYTVFRLSHFALLSDEKAK